MAVYEIKHPIWGSNFENQLEVDKINNPGDDGDGYVNVTVRGFLGREKEVKKYVGNDMIQATDNDEAKRYYHHKCGLLKIIMMPRQYNPSFIVFLDGHITSEFSSREMELRIKPGELTSNDDKPIAEIWFYGTGTRYGPLHRYETYRLICTFSSQEQLNAYLGSAGAAVIDD